jgi:hypothetical protein
MVIANDLSPPVCFKPAVIIYHHLFEMNPAVMTNHHRQVVLRTGGDRFSNITVGS